MAAVVTSKAHFFQLIQKIVLLNSSVVSESCQLNKEELPPYDAFHNKLRKRNPLEKEYLDY